ncbi:BPG_G0053440.mRNA.1.CDS.1 [Saccharomyces cerevisiae]|nr:BPG_G0053440.mRNA.1.CDS.1 [Saccharomyces cerevisiae]CAI7373141.1 BPG_G0053440.mRNA.1.CDS.1 [Saccharomyces cerevisiae]
MSSFAAMQYFRYPILPKSFFTGGWIFFKTRRLPVLDARECALLRHQRLRAKKRNTRMLGFIESHNGNSFLKGWR